MPLARHLAAAIALTLVALAGRTAHAGNLYVDNRAGDDIFDGRAEHAVNETSGPVRTIRRALQRVRPGDVAHIAHRGRPYCESLAYLGSSLGNGFRLEGPG